MSNSYTKYPNWYTNDSSDENEPLQLPNYSTEALAGITTQSGMVVWNVTSGQVNIYDGSIWQSLTMP